MDSAIWREFPAELQERVLALLPLPLLFRCRVVCKSWNALVRTPAFSEIPHEQSYALVAPTFSINRVHHQRGKCQYWRVYDVMAKQWYKLPTLNCLFYRWNQYGWNQIRTVGAAGGLICVLRTSYDDSEGSLVVCNPIAKTINNDLPQCTARGHEVGDKVVMAFDDVTNSYKIFVIRTLHFRGDTGRFHVYESITQRWRSLAKVPNHSVVSSSIFFQGVLYTLFDVGAGSRHTLLAYDIHEDSWMETGVQIPKSVQIPQLVVTNGGLYLFGGFNNELDAIETALDVQSWYPKILQIWEVQFSSKRCVEIEKMPYNIIQGILGKRCDSYQRRDYYSIASSLQLGNKTGAIVTAVGFGTSILITSWNGVPTIFELSNHKWQLVPQLPQPADRLDHGLREHPLLPQGQGLSANLINLNLGARV